MLMQSYENLARPLGVKDFSYLFVSHLISENTLNSNLKMDKPTSFKQQNEFL